MSTKKLQLLGSLGEKIYKQNEEPENAEVGALWVDLDEESGGGSGSSSGSSSSGGSSNVVAGSADWNQDDPNGAGYIANRTHYTEQEKWNEIFRLHVENPTYEQFWTKNYYTRFEIPFKTSSENGEFEPEKIYRVHLNGHDYELAAKFHAPPLLGNLNIMVSSVSDNGIPFMLDTLKIGFANQERPEVIDLVVYDYYAKVHKLDEKYIDYKPGRTVTGQEFEIPNHQYGDDEETLIAGEGAEIFNDYLDNIAIGEYSHAEGTWTRAVGYCSHAEGDCTYAFGDDSHAEGFCTQTFNYNAHAEGAYTIASGEQSHAEGDNTKALGESSHAEGSNTFAGDWADHTEGDSTVAVGNASHAEGEYTTAVGYASHAEGSGDYYGAYVTGEAGSDTYVLDDEYNIYPGCVITYSDYYGSGVHAYGIVEDYDPDTLTVTLSNSLNDEEDMDNENVYIYYYGVAAGDYSHVEGTGSIALGENQHVQGQYNIPDADGVYAHIVGNGSDHEERSNAHTLDWDGNAWFAGDVYVGGTSKDDADRLVKLSELSNLGGGITGGSGATGGSANWNQNDPNGVGYVANRTHYTEEEKWNEVFNFVAETPEYVVSSYAPWHDSVYFDNGITGSDRNGLVRGQTYLVRLNGQEYELVWNGFFGSSTIIQMNNGVNDGNPFYIASNRIAFVHDEYPESIDLSISEYYAKVVQLDEKYISYKPGKVVAGQEFVVEINEEEQTFTAEKGAEIFNDYEHNIATGEFSHAEGDWTLATGDSSHAEGCCTEAHGDSSHAEGYGMVTEDGEAAHAEGEGYAFQYAAHAEGCGTASCGYGSHSEGYETEALEYADHAEGNYTVAAGGPSHAEGDWTIAFGYASHAEGNRTVTVGSCSHAEGDSGNENVIEVYITGEANSSTFTLDSDYDIQVGDFIVYQTRFDYETTYEPYVRYAFIASYDPATLTITTSKRFSGSNAIDGEQAYIYRGGVAFGDCSHIEGEGTFAMGTNQHVQGRHNIIDTNETYAHIVGNGTVEEKSNAHTLDWSGNAWYAGSVEATSLILKSPGGKRFSITVDDSGTLSATEIT